MAGNTQSYKVYRELPSIHGTRRKGHSDGQTIYRPIARQVIGDPAQATEIKNAVMQFAIRIRANSSHPSHRQYMGKELDFANLTRQPRTLFAALECPDFAPTEHVLWVIAQALGFQICIFHGISTSGTLPEPLQQVGSSELPVCRLLKVGKNENFASLLVDVSGKSLVGYLLEQQKVLGQQSKKTPSASCVGIKRISWTWEKKISRSFPPKCYNQYRPDSKLADLDGSQRLSRMDTFVVVVNEPQQVKPALDLLKEVLRRAPFQRRSVRTTSGCYEQLMLPHIAADCEFVKYTRASQSDAEFPPEEMCSVMCLGVSRHFFIMFNIVAMLEKPNQHTVPAIELLFRQVIFNPKLVKLWWNPEIDVIVMNRTIQQMYRGNGRPRTRSDHYHNADVEAIEPSDSPQYWFHSPFFDGKRPADLYFSLKITDDRTSPDCGIHPHDGGLRFVCHCHTGNIELAALLNSFCRQIGIDTPLVKWPNFRDKFNYADLLGAMLGHDRLAPILKYMKDAASRSPKGTEGFYKDLGLPGMAQDDCAMGYNIGDVAGQNLIFEELLACKDKNFVCGALYACSGKEEQCVADGPLVDYRELYPARTLLQSALRHHGDVPVFLDNPIAFLEPLFSNQTLKHRLTKLLPCRRARSPYNIVVDEQVFNLANTALLKPWEHDKRVAILRQYETNQCRGSIQAQLYTFPPDDFLAELCNKQKVVLQDMLDPTLLCMPHTMVLPAPARHDTPVVRAGSTYSEALIDLLRSLHTTGMQPPPGFLAPRGDPDGLPERLNRYAGQDLPDANAIRSAYNRKSSRQPGGVPRRLSRSENEKTYLEFQREKDAFIANIVGDHKDNENLNAAEGRPVSFDKSDVFDPEGRNYRKRARLAQDWNQPGIVEGYEVAANGEWMSLATVKEKTLNERLQLEESDWDVTAEWNASSPNSKRLRE
ncbi:hypothetical protein LTR62_007935 [Meristemomyces frigidus]|uniref:Uncharacterized protein n=1 Tax=Meristemomyces frigidus TaxID=1508187 RepID=A0AAN7TM24_9PEZI|nr:hypothetical protein LTR62_007935 [Meristemomyces frigidus]